MELGTSVSYRAMRELKSKSPAAYKKRKREIADRLIDLVARHHIPNIREHVKLRLVGSPTTNEDFVGAPFGNAYGASLSPENVNRRLEQETPIDNLYWCNATAGFPSFCGTASTGMQLYSKLTHDRAVGEGPRPTREERERQAIAAYRATGLTRSDTPLPSCPA